MGDEDHIDYCEPGEPEDSEDFLDFSEADCGRWRNGRLVYQCMLAGTEDCDWECPIGLPKRKRRGVAIGGSEVA